MRGNGQKQLQKRSFQPGKKKLHQESSETLGQAAQRSCGISILGDFKMQLDKALDNLTKLRGWPLLSRGLEQMNSKNSHLD